MEKKEVAYSTSSVLSDETSSEISSSDRYSKTVILKSSDRHEFVVDVNVAKMSGMIATVLEDCKSQYEPISVMNVKSDSLTKVVEYCKRHVVDLEKQELADLSDEEYDKFLKEKESLATWDAEFVKMDIAKLFNVILAANYLDIKGLLDLSCQAVADYIKDMSVEDVRQVFHIENDFTPEEEEEIRQQHAWAYE